MFDVKHKVELFFSIHNYIYQLYTYFHFFLILAAFLNK